MPCIGTPPNFKILLPTPSFIFSGRVEQIMGVRPTSLHSSIKAFVSFKFQDLKNQNLLINDQGAQCVFLDGVVGKDGKPQPIIIQKSDGGFNYATTDLAAIKYRLTPPPQGDGAGRLIYVTDAGKNS